MNRSDNGTGSGIAGSSSRRPAGPRRPARGARSRYPTLFCAALAGWLGAAASAHDIYSSWTDSYVRSDRFEMTLTLARSSAVRLLPEGNALPPVTPENFKAYAPRLKAIAPDLFEITSAGQPLKLTSAEVKISGDADVSFLLVFPRPAAGPLRFVAHYLFHLVDGHVGTLVVSDAGGRDLGWSPVSVDQPVFQLTLPASKPPDKKP